MLSAQGPVGRWCDELGADGRQALRSLRSSRLFVVIALATVTAAIGLSTAVFSLVAGVLLDPLPYPRSDRIVRLAEFRPDRGPIPPVGGRLTSVTIGVWESQTKVLDALVPYSFSGRNVMIGAASEQIVVASVGGAFFDLLGATPLQGRLIAEEDDRQDAPPVAVISRRLWTQSFGGRADITNSVVTLDGLPHTIIGVAAASDFPAREIDIWVPGRWRWPLPGGRGNMMMSIEAVGRMRDGASLDELRREGTRVLTTIATSDPAFADGATTVPTLRVTRLLDDIVLETRPALTAILVGMGLVLLAACASLANLLVARNTARSRDLAIRTTLGATRVRLLRPLFFEQIVLTGGGAVLGGVAGWWVLRALPALAPDSLPRLSEVRFHWSAWLAGGGIALVTGMLVGLRPAFGNTAPGLRDLSAASRIRTRGANRSADLFRGGLVTAQVALALILLVGASLIGRSLLRLVHTSPGYEPSGVLTFQIGIPELSWREKGRLTRLYDELFERIRAVPGVTAVGSASRLPLHHATSSGTFRIVGEPRPLERSDWPRAHMTMISSDYLRALGGRLLAGRGFEPTDRVEARPVVLVDEMLADRYFGGDAVGRRVHSYGNKEWTIVGVIQNVKPASISDGDEATLYFPSSQVGEVSAFNRYGGGIAVRTSGDPAALMPVVREFVRELDPEAPVFNLMALADRLDATFDQPRFYSVILALFAALTLGTAVLGVFGVQAYAVERRRAEFGVRRALGAGERHIVGLVLRRAALVAAGGLLVGLPLAAAGAGLLRSMLFGVSPLDPATFAVASFIAVALVMAASWQPAKRALQIDPAEALRSE